MGFEPAQVEQEIVIALSEQLRYLRRYNRVTQKQTADALHIERSTYAYYELRKTEPSLSMLVRLARLFDVTTDFLLGIQKEKETDSRLEQEVLRLVEEHFSAERK